jgi:hypothetical protein
LRELEKLVLTKVEAELAAYTNLLASTGRTYRGPEIENWNSTEARYSSELRVTILRNGQIDDVLEFHVYHNGEPQVTDDQAGAWVRDQLAAIVSGHDGHTPP